MEFTPSKSSTDEEQSSKLFKITRKRVLKSLDDRRQSESEDEDEPLLDVEASNDQSLNTILCILFKNGKIAASYYKLNEKMIYILDEMVDLQPEFSATRSLIREKQPSHVITVGNICDKFVKSLIDMMSDNDVETTIESDQLKNIPNNMSVLSFKEYEYNSCEYRVKSLRLLSEPDSATDEERLLYLNSLINFQSNIAIYSLGVLIKFIEKSWSHLRGDNNDHLVFYHIKQAVLLDQVYIDRTTFNALQIFKKMTHDASFKHGGNSSTREGISLYRLFSQYCKSKLGYMKMKHIMMAPTKNMEELNKRLDFIDFVLQPTSQAFVESLEENIKHISDVSIILGKIQHGRATNKHWETLYRTIYHILFLNELCAPYRHQSKVLVDLEKATTETLYQLERSIDDALDFKGDMKKKRPVIKVGLDEDLDKNKMLRDDISKHIDVAAKLVVDQLPDFLEECTVFYIPDMGHVVAIKKWDTNFDPNDLSSFGLQYMFELNDYLHYKNALCQEMDRQLGDIQTLILQHENRIIERIAGFVLRYNDFIREPLQIISLMDCLISMAKVASERGYVRPKLNNENIHEIKNGRHPLLELISYNYVGNNFYSGGSHSHMKIITGPNASGKSVYLKQTALLIYLAHIGSYIPASQANISMIHSIHSRMHATESALLHLSAFMIDLTQMSQALYNAKSNSLVIMDEFGRGTTGREGLALLTGALRKFLHQGEFCPHVIVSTHFEVDSELLDSPFISYEKMEYTRDPNKNDIVFLYKLGEGVASSYGLEIAASVGLNKDILLRANDILRDFKNVKPIQKFIPKRYDIKEKDINIKFLKNIRIGELDEN